MWDPVVITAAIVSALISIGSVTGVALISWGRLSQIIQSHDKRISDVEKSQKTVMGHEDVSAVTRNQCSENREFCVNNVCRSLESMREDFAFFKEKLEKMDTLREEARKETKDDMKQVYDKLEAIRKQNGNSK